MTITATRMKPLYDVKLITYERSHFYTINDDETMLPGVTTALSSIAKPALVPWAAKTATDNIKEYLMQHATGRILTVEEIEKACLEGKNLYKKKSAEAADIGSRAHKAINAIVEGREPVVDEETKIPVEAFRKYVETKALKIEMGDTKIASAIHKYGGSLDAIGIEDGKVIIVDFKTSKAIYAEYAFQVAAYSYAFQETYGLDYLPDALIIRVGKDKPDFEVKRVTNIEQAFLTFKAALTLYRMSKFNFYKEEKQDE